MIKTKESRIDGVTYKVTQLGAKDGRATLVRLTKMLGPAMARVADAKDAENIAALVPALETLLQDVTEQNLAELCDTFAARTIYSENGKDWPMLDRGFDDHFAGEYVRMFRWLVFAIEVNYADFFGALKARVTAARSASEEAKVE